MDFSRLTGWIGLLLLTLSFCTAVKIPYLNTFLGGYRKQIKLHHYMGLGASFSISLHLIILLFQYSEAIDLLFDPLDIATLAGWIAYFCTTIVVIVAFRFRSLPYRRWRRIHLLLILSFLSSLLHSYLILEPRSIQEWGTLGGTTLIGISAIVWILFISQRASFGTPYAIIKQSNLRSDLFIQTLRPSSVADNIRFQAGDFVFLRYKEKQFSSIWHPFTVIGFSDSGEFELLIKARGRDTNLLKNIELPSQVNINGPFGNVFWQSNEPQLWLAYGVGIAIFIAAARNIPNNYTSKVHFVYCDKSSDHIVLRDEFDLINRERSQFTWEQALGEGKEVLADLEKKVELWSKEYKLIRICGHPGFQDSAKELFKSAGVPNHAIILEGIY